MDHVSEGKGGGGLFFEVGGVMFLGAVVAVWLVLGRSAETSSIQTWMVALLATIQASGLLTSVVARSSGSALRAPVRLSEIVLALVSVGVVVAILAGSNLTGRGGGADGSRWLAPGLLGVVAVASLLVALLRIVRFRSGSDGQEVWRLWRFGALAVAVVWLIS